MTTRRSYDQACPVAHALDVVGERWTLLIVRDLMFGPLRFTDLRRGLPGLAPNLLSERLRMLTDHGLIEQVELPAPAARTVYVLTSHGRELSPVVHALARFGLSRWPDPERRPPTPRLMRGAVLSLMTPELLDSPGWVGRIELPDTSIGITVAPANAASAALERLRLVDPAPLEGPDADVVVEATLRTLVDLRQQRRRRSDAEAQGRLRVSGEARAVDRMAALLGWS